MNTATKLRDEGLEQVSEHNIYWKASAMRELRCMTNRAKHPKMKEQLFTFEDILPDLEYLVGRPLPNFNLAGAIMRDAIMRKYIEPTGRYIQTKGDIKHSRKAAEYRWKAGTA